MVRSWTQRRHGWTCRECGAFNPCDNFNCDSGVCDRRPHADDAEERRWRKVSRRWGRLDFMTFRSLSGELYRASRFVGNKGTVVWLIPGVSPLRVSPWLAPLSVTTQADAHFNNPHYVI